MRKMYLLFVIITITLLMQTKANADTVYVNVMQAFFDPADFSVNVGDYVAWTLMQGSHTTTSNSIPAGAAAWDYTFSGTGDTYIYGITEAGTYNYECLFHFGMNGSFTAVEPATFQLSVSVDNSWNMVSIPGLHPTNQDVTTWWSGKDPAAGVFRFAAGYQAVTAAVPGTGYWMKHVGANTYNTGDEWPAGGINIVTHDPLVAATGWNLIGGYEENVLTSGITTTPPGLLSGSVFGFTPGLGYQVSNSLVPGYGYWIKLTGSGQINIPNALVSENVRIVEKIPENWGKILISDNAGWQYILYIVDGEVNLNNYELPPAPPSGMFDVRFGSNRYAEELSASSQTIELNSLEYPVTVRVEGVSIRIQDETGKTVNARLKSGEEVSVSQSINKLMVSADIIPDKYALEQNYPNPFNPSTTVQFDIPKTSDVVIKIYDMLGQEVKTLFAGQVEGGTYKVQWDGLNNASQVISSGTYVYRIVAGEYVQSKKMVLLK